MGPNTAAVAAGEDSERSWEYVRADDGTATAAEDEAEDAAEDEVRDLEDAAEAEVRDLEDPAQEEAAVAAEFTHYGGVAPAEIAIGSVDPSEFGALDALALDGRGEHIPVSESPVDSPPPSPKPSPKPVKAPPAFLRGPKSIPRPTKAAIADAVGRMEPAQAANFLTSWARDSDMDSRAGNASPRSATSSRSRGWDCEPSAPPVKPAPAWQLGQHHQHAQQVHGAAFPAGPQTRLLQSVRLHRP